MFSQKGQGLIVVVIIIAIVVLGMYLVAHNQNDVFTSFWASFGHVVDVSQSMK